jgi:hypothetical protein
VQYRLENESIGSLSKPLAKDSSSEPKLKLIGEIK